ncbi:MAG: polyprenyl diphosphate synthase [Janthinobacterium lividum]
MKSDTASTNPAAIEQLKARLDPARIPAHVAIIMDGNGRWAHTQGQDRLFGHWQGYRALKEIVSAADDLGIQTLTVFGFSTENWRRPEAEVDGLMELMQAAMQAEIEELIQNKVHIRVTGRLYELPDSLRETFENAMRRTADFAGMTFNLAINYGGRAEIADAARALAEAVQRGELRPDEITEEKLSAHMYAPSLPDPDLLIRTAGEMRISNFLLWGIAYSEIWVTPTLWPDFTPTLLVDALEDYGRRVRKFGAVAN